MIHLALWVAAALVVAYVLLKIWSLQQWSDKRAKDFNEILRRLDVLEEAHDIPGRRMPSASEEPRRAP